MRAFQHHGWGHARIEWVLDTGVRNEPLDCRVYGHAALHGLYASGLSLAEAATKIASAPLRIDAIAADAPRAPMPRTIRSRWLEGG